MSNLMTHMRESAEAGSVDAQFNLGVLLGNGFDDKGRFVGAKRDEAILWLRKAADRGLSRAQSKLAQTYADGDAPSDIEHACAWYLVAMENTDGGGGRHGACDAYEKIARRLSPEQLEWARTNSQAWIKKIHSENSIQIKERSLMPLRKRRA